MIVTEPTGGYIQPVEGGLEWLRLGVRGVAGHTAKRYLSVHAGGQGTAVNPIEKMMKLLAAVQELERYWGVHKVHPLMPKGVTTINIGVVLGGAGGGTAGMPNLIGSPSTFPNYCSTLLSLKYLPSKLIRAGNLTSLKFMLISGKGFLENVFHIAAITSPFTS